MATVSVSVKLSDATKARVDRLAANNGTSPHALMIEAIEAALERGEKHDAFVEAARQSRAQMIASGKAYDGDEYLAYARARLSGEKATRPRQKAIKTLGTTSR
ncbi:CopG family ribbon-helix-helix protein [Caenimonas koreensis]|nr:ribbon-helix-helix protein, CopG family [Caenimonas koreensis]